MDKKRKGGDRERTEGENKERLKRWARGRSEERGKKLENKIHEKADEVMDKRKK